MGLNCSHDAYSAFNRPLPKDWSHLLKPLIDGHRRNNWREKKPALVSTVTGAKRLANREEIKFMKDNKQYGWKPL